MPQTGPSAKLPISAGRSEKSNLINVGISIGSGISISCRRNATADKTPVTVITRTRSFDPLPAFPAGFPAAPSFRFTVFSALSSVMVLPFCRILRGSPAGFSSVQKGESMNAAYPMPVPVSRLLPASDRKKPCVLLLRGHRAVHSQIDFEGISDASGASFSHLA